MKRFILLLISLLISISWANAQQYALHFDVEECVTDRFSITGVYYTYCNLRVSASGDATIPRGTVVYYSTGLADAQGGVYGTVRGDYITREDLIPGRGGPRFNQIQVALVRPLVTGDYIMSINRIDLQNNAYRIRQTANNVFSYRYRITAQPGSISALINPPELRGGEAQWRAPTAAGGMWQQSGATLEVPAGQYSIEFKPINGWITPEPLTNLLVGSQSVSVNSRPSVQVTGEYRRAAGDIQVVINPNEALQSGAQWRVNNGPWQGSGNTLTNVAPGVQRLEFKEIPGWARPVSENVSINGGQTTSLARNYVQQGSIEVTIVGGDSAGRWNIGEKVDWKPGGIVVGMLNPGPKQIQFADVNGWSRPAPMQVTINPGQTQRVTANYIRPIGSLRVTIQPEKCVAAGAKWRANGGSWLNSGELASGLPAGPHRVEYSSIPGCAHPSPDHVTISSGASASHIGRYIDK